MVTPHGEPEFPTVYRRRIHRVAGPRVGSLETPALRL